MKGFRQDIKNFLIKGATLVVGVVFLFSGNIHFADAATKKPVAVSKQTTLNKKYNAQLYTLIKEVVVAPKESATFTLSFKNTGKETWVNSGPKMVSLYTDPSTRVSPFYSKEWIDSHKVVKLSEKKVVPGGVGTFVVPLQVGGKEGTYEEKFKVAVEDVTWIKGTYVTIPISVAKAVSTNAKSGSVAKSTVEPSSNLSGNILLRSHTAVEAVGGSSVELRYGIKNSGPTVWKNVTLAESGVAIATINASPFHDSSWADTRIAVALGTEEYASGRMALFNFTARMPDAVGSYVFKLQLNANGVPIEGTEIELPITITSPAPDQSINSNVSLPPTPALWVGVPEPKMRVGVQNTENARITVNIPYAILNDQNVAVGTLAPGVVGELMLDAATGGEVLKAGDLYLNAPYFRLEPTDWKTGVFTITNFENRLKWNKSENDNAYRGAVELRVSVYGNAWLVNEIPLDEYVKGIDEVPNVWATEFHKAQAIAARSYALYYMERGGKHNGTAYILNAGSYDQVYRGYNAEIRNTRFVSAVEATRGTVVRYEGSTAATVYFARSNGTTKSWSAVWGGKGYPYIQPRDAEFDAAKRNTEFGHGVGMPQTDGAMRADAGATYDQILNAYYTGITIDRVYE